MNNSKLTVTVRNKVPEIRFGEYLVSDNKQLKIVFDLDSEWDAFAHKTARFDLDGWQFDIAFTGDTVTLPLLPAYSGELSVGVYAGDLSTTTSVRIPVRSSVLARSGEIGAEDAAEIARVAAEAARVDAENARAAAEALRVQAENTRVSNENARIQAESARQSAERGRADAESARVSAENARAAAESARSDAENEREHTENARELSEYRRNLAEQARQDAESARAAAEAARVSAEAARSEAETQRASAERTRSGAESERNWSESLRQGAESLRASAESTRAAQEAARQSAETARASAERIRSSAETARAQNELDRIAAEIQREQRIAAVIAEFGEYMQQNDVFDVLALIREYGTRNALRLFCLANAPLIGLDTAVLRFFAAASATVVETYTSSFYRYSTSTSPVGTKKDANAGLVCEPSTNDTAGRDDYADLPLFACFDCNYTIDGTTLEPVLHAIKDVYGEFSASPSDSFVGVLQMTGWVRRTADNTEKTVEYAAYRKEAGFDPLPEAVRASDNSVRPFVIHAKYAAGYNSAGKLSSVSGAQPVTGRPSSAGGRSVGRDAQITLWRAWGDQYCGASICDQAFLQTMLEIKYACLGSSQVMRGVDLYSAYASIRVSETGVKRAIVSYATNYLVGMCVSLGTSHDRSAAACYNVCPIAAITNVEDINVNGMDYKALTLDTPNTFDTDAMTTRLVLHPWKTGSTDAVKGNDGSPYNNLSGKEPFKLQGIELMLGAGEAMGSTLLKNNPGSIGIYENRRASQITSGGGASGMANLGTINKVNENTTYPFIAELNWTGGPEAYMLPASIGGSANSSRGYCASLHQTSYNRGGYSSAYSVYGPIGGTDNNGLAFIEGTFESLTSQGWEYTCRACGTAGNRGVYTVSSGSIG
ncbi:MAG: hypothetical protein IKI64_00870 [Clostridia bacterium]|nr:hypothetical protein [Clostridia bacterium]